MTKNFFPRTFPYIVSQHKLASLVQVSLSTFGYLYLSSDLSLAQVTSDGTVNTQVNQDGNIVEITEGETRGDNLFHSFQDFSVGTGNEAFFNNASNIANIFSRVTGGNLSNINGLIRANGSANLFLINPAGIIFGENSRLDIGGSFYGSSASSILFEDGEFSAADLANPPVLTINAPIGLGFRDNPGNIVNRSVANQGRGLEVSADNELSLIGGDVNFEGGRVFAPGGIVNLGGLTSTGTFRFAADRSLSSADNLAKANVSLTDNAVVNVASDGGGLIAVDVNNLKLTDNSLLLAGINEGLGIENSVAGTIDINATNFFADNNSIIRTDNLGIGKAGTINITTDTLDFDNGSAIVVSTFGQGDAGTVNIIAQNISFDREWGGIFATTGLQRIQTEPLINNAIGNAGEININTDNLALTNGAQLQVNSVAKGDAGTINIQATGAVDFIGQGETPIEDFDGGKVTSGALSQVRGEASANSGKVKIEAGSLTLIDKGGIITNSSSGKGNAGEIELNVRGLIFLKDSAQVLSQTGEGGIGDSGNIKIDTGSLEITNSSFILADSKGQGDSGNIDITASGTVLLKGFQPGNPFPSQIVNQLTDKANGAAGDINIDARELIMEDVSFISSSNGSNTIGSAGKINIDVERFQLTNNAFINAFTNNNSDAGVITINAQTLDLLNGGKILAATDGGGNAGNINLNISGDIKIDNSIKSSAKFVNFNPDSNSQSLELLNDRQSSPSGIYGDATERANGSGGNIYVSGNSLLLNSDATISASTNFGQGGEITLDITDDITLANNSLISAEAGGSATGGNVNIDTGFIVAFPNQIDGDGNDIIASAAEGNGGRIEINAESLLGIKERKTTNNNQTNDLDASSDFGLDGKVSIFIPDINPVQSATELPRNVVEPEQTTTQACQANRAVVSKSSLVVRGKGGTSPTPDLPLTSQNIIIDDEYSNAIYTEPQPIKTSQGKIQPVRGVKVTKNGQVILTVYRTNNLGERLPEGRINCGK